MESNREVPQSERILRGGQIVERVLLAGAVKFFDDGRGWGYIERDDGEKPDVFVHFSQIKGLGARHRQLFPGDRVRFEVIDRGRGPMALKHLPK